MFDKNVLQSKSVTGFIGLVVHSSFLDFGKILGVCISPL